MSVYFHCSTSGQHFLNDLEKKMLNVKKKYTTVHTVATLKLPNLVFSNNIQQSISS